MGSSSSSQRRRSPSATQTHRTRAPPAHTAQQQPSVIRNQQNPPPMPHHLAQQHPSYMQRAPPAAAQRNATPQVHAEVKDAKNVVALCTVQAKTVKLTGDCIYFVATTQVPHCAYEIHVAVRESIRNGQVAFTPNKSKPAPVAITIDGEHDELDLVAPLELNDVSEQEKKYLKEYPKQLPVVLCLRYVTPAGVEMSEYTYIQLLPEVKVFRQLIGTPEGVFKVENLFGLELDDGAGTAVVAEGGASPTAGTNFIDDEDTGEECVICLTNPKDTAVMPCRHLCLCKDCAEPLRKQSPKCPVCRGPIDQLVHIGHH